MSRWRLYRYSETRLSFYEVRLPRVRYTLCGVFFGILFLIGSFSINQYYGDALGIGIVQRAALMNENRALKDQLMFLAQRLEKVQKSLEELGDKGNELRLLADLPKVDDDLKKAGTGGSDSRVEISSSPDINDLINRLRTSVSQTERELSFQKASYSQVARNLVENKTRFMHLPAIKPMEGYYSHHDIGMRFHPVLHIWRKHEGLDIANNVGTPIYATANGTIEFTGHEGGFGLLIEINHGYGYKTVYGHLSKILVREGQTVKRGDLIALSGNSGLSAGPHLHYEVRCNGIAQNPIDYFFDDIKPQNYLSLRERK